MIKDDDSVTSTVTESSLKGMDMVLDATTTAAILACTGYCSSGKRKCSDIEKVDLDDLCRSPTKTSCDTKRWIEHHTRPLLDDVSTDPDANDGLHDPSTLSSAASRTNDNGMEGKRVNWKDPITIEGKRSGKLTLLSSRKGDVEIFLHNLTTEVPTDTLQQQGSSLKRKLSRIVRKQRPSEGRSRKRSTKGFGDTIKEKSFEELLENPEDEDVPTKEICDSPFDASTSIVSTSSISSSSSSTRAELDDEDKEDEESTVVSSYGIEIHRIATNLVSIIDPILWLCEPPPLESDASIPPIDTTSFVDEDTIRVKHMMENDATPGALALNTFRVRTFDTEFMEGTNTFNSPRSHRAEIQWVFDHDPVPFDHDPVPFDCVSMSTNNDHGNDEDDRVVGREPRTFFSDVVSK